MIIIIKIKLLEKLPPSQLILRDLFDQDVFARPSSSCPLPKRSQVAMRACTSDVANQTPFVLFVPKPNTFGLVKNFTFGRLYQTSCRPQTKRS
jgi:hypothetical protein